MHEFFMELSFWVNLFFFGYFGVINVLYSILLVLGTITVYRRRKELSIEHLSSILRSNSLPEISFFVAAWNESKNICPVVDNLLNLSYRYKQVIVINDGSTDNMMELLKEKYQLVPIPIYYEHTLPTAHVRNLFKSVKRPELLVIDKDNGNKHDAINAAINACHNKYYIGVDADTFVDDESFEALIHPMLMDPEMVAMGTSVRIRNGCLLHFNKISTNLFPIDYVSAMQSLEYLRSFLMRQGWDYLGGNFCLSGAFSIFVTDVVRKLGGYAPTHANDLEITLRLHHAMLASKTPYKMQYIPDPVGWTEVPPTIKVLAGQRFTWQRSTMDSFWYHRKMFFNPFYGMFGMLSFPFLFFGEILEAIVEMLGYIYIVLGCAFGIINSWNAFLLLGIILGFTFVHTLYCLIIEELSFRKYPSPRSLFYLFVYSLIENIGYRQLSLIWRIKGFFGFFKRWDIVQQQSEEINRNMNKVIEKGRIKF